MRKPFDIEHNNEKLRIIEWSIDLMHQTETKSLSILGFYMAFAGLLIGFLLTEPPIFPATLIIFCLFIFGGLTIDILAGYRNWKNHYLGIIQTNLEELGIRCLDLPTSLRYDRCTREKIYDVPVDTIARLIPFLFLAIAIAIFVYYYAHKMIRQFL